MSQQVAAQIYLVTPAQPAMSVFPNTLARLLDDVEIACVRLNDAGASEDTLAHSADTLREICHARDVPLVIANHFRLVRPLGLDGVHLSDGTRNIRTARKEIPKDAVIGVHARASRHDGLIAGEIGADYVSFGPLSQSSLGDGTLAPLDLFQWWSEMIEIPSVAEGEISPETCHDIRYLADFVALGNEIWSHPEGPADALKTFVRALEISA